MSEELLVRNCAPTLAGLKTASLFNCPYESREELLSSLRQLNRRLGPKGVRAIPLRFSEKRALVYLYRPARLEQDLSANASAALLRQCGYTSCQSGKCLTSLARKLRQRGEFPHEIGLFLGYPAADVRGFLEQRPCKCRLLAGIRKRGSGAEDLCSLQEVYRHLLSAACRRHKH